MTRNTKKDETPETIKQELLVSIVEISDEEEDYLEINQQVKNANEPKDAISSQRSKQRNHKHSGKARRVA